MRTKIVAVTSHMLVCLGFVVFSVCKNDQETQIKTMENSFKIEDKNVYYHSESGEVEAIECFNKQLAKIKAPKGLELTSGPRPSNSPKGSFDHDSSVKKKSFRRREIFVKVRFKVKKSCKYYIEKSSRLAATLNITRFLECKYVAKCRMKNQVV